MSVTVTRRRSTFIRRLLSRVLPGWIISLLIIFAAFFAFLSLAEDVWLKEDVSWDVSLMRDIHRLSAPWLDTVMKGVTYTASTTALVLASILAIWLWYARRQKLQSMAVAVTIVGSTLLNTLLKELFARPRPNVFKPITVARSYSFPSGHTSTAIAFYGLVAVLLWRSRHRGWALLSGLWVLAVAFSRVYLGVHYPSDVLAALALGVVWIAAVMLVYDRFLRRASPATKQAVASEDKAAEPQPQQ